MIAKLFKYVAVGIIFFGGLYLSAEAIMLYQNAWSIAGTLLGTGVVFWVTAYFIDEDISF